MRTNHQKKFGKKVYRSIDYGQDWRKISAAIKKRDDYLCQDCGSDSKLETHHILPLSKGGKNTQLNMVTLCSNCHNKRHFHKHKRL